MLQVEAEKLILNSNGLDEIRDLLALLRGDPLIDQLELSGQMELL